MNTIRLFQNVHFPYFSGIRDSHTTQQGEYTTWYTYSAGSHDVVAYLLSFHFISGNFAGATKAKLFFVFLQKLQQELEFLEVQEEYIKDEQKNLKKEFLHAQEEVKRIQSIPLVIGQFLEAVDQNTAIVGSTTGAVLILFAGS